MKLLYAVGELSIKPQHESNVNAFQWVLSYSPTVTATVCKRRTKT